MTQPGASDDLLAYLNTAIRDGEDAGEDEDDMSWGHETGVLLSRAQAKVARAALSVAEACTPEGCVVNCVIEMKPGDIAASEALNGARLDGYAIIPLAVYKALVAPTNG